MPVKRSPWRMLGAACIVAAGFCMVSAVLVLSLGGSTGAGRDFIEYWAAEQQLAHGGNPYGTDEIERVEKSAGFTNERPEFWYSPPVVICLALPLGFVSAKTGLALWTIGLFASLSLSIWMVWLMHGQPNTLLHLLGYLFAPVVTCFQAGQISVYLLLFVVLFLYLHRKLPLLAGAALLPLTLKPHLFFPFAVAVLLWIVSRKAYRVLIGFAVALAACAGLTLALDGQVWSQYSHMMNTEGMLNEFVPTLGETFRYLINRNAVWLQFLPVALASVWAVWYFWSRRERWDWMYEGMLLLLVSGMCRPYGWFFDESVVLPAVLTALILAKRAGRSLWPIALVGAVVLCETIEVIPMTSKLYLWTSPAWLACFLYATYRQPKPSPDLPIASPAI